MHANLDLTLTGSPAAAVRCQEIQESEMSARQCQASWWPYALAMLSVVAAAGGVALGQHLIGAPPFLLFALAAAGSAVYGLRPGLLAASFACLVSDFLFLPPFYVLALDARTAHLGSMYLLGVLVSHFARAVQASKQAEVAHPAPEDAPTPTDGERLQERNGQPHEG
jgi:K+-sensing histidine kinase KdpD